MKYSQEQQSNDHGRVLRAIFTIWFVSIMVGLPIVLGLNASPNPELETQCKFHNATFIIISSVASFYIPCSIILILYYRIMKVGLFELMEGQNQIWTASLTSRSKTFLLPSLSWLLLTLQTSIFAGHSSA